VSCNSNSNSNCSCNCNSIACTLARCVSSSAAPQQQRSCSWTTHCTWRRSYLLPSIGRWRHLRITHSSHNQFAFEHTWTETFAPAGWPPHAARQEIRKELWSPLAISTSSTWPKVAYCGSHPAPRVDPARPALLLLLQPLTIGTLQVK
jgi:hypothetical protein